MKCAGEAARNEHGASRSSWDGIRRSAPQQSQQQTKAAKGRELEAAFPWLEKLEGADSDGESVLQIQLSALWCGMVRRWMLKINEWRTRALLSLYLVYYFKVLKNSYREMGWSD